MKFTLSAVILFNGCQLIYSLLENDSYEGSDESYLRGAGRALKKFPPKGFTTDPLTNCSLTCAPCPIGCLQSSCSSKPIYLQPKNDFYPPVNVMQRPFGPYPVAPNATAENTWWTSEVLAKYPKMIKQSDTIYNLTATEVMLLKMGLTEWMDARAAGKYTCVEMVTAMVKRALYLQEIRHMNQFMYWGTFDWIKVVMKEAAKLDNRAARKGTSSIAPMYCYPIPVKGTVSTDWC